MVTPTFLLSIECDALAVPAIQSPTVPGGEALLLAIDSADPILNAESKVLGADRLGRAGAVTEVSVALACHTADGMARRLTEPETKPQEQRKIFIDFFSLEVYPGTISLTRYPAGTWRAREP